MKNSDNSPLDQRFLANSMASFIQIGALLVLLTWCFKIVSPFLNVVIWAVIIAIALYPGHVALSNRLQGREKLSAAILALVGLAIIVIPAWALADSMLGGLQHLATEFEDGIITIPPPDPQVAQWPLIGHKIHQLWGGAASNLEATLNEFTPQIQALGQSLLAFGGIAVAGVLQLIFSIFVAAALLGYAPSGYRLTREFSARLVGIDRGPRLTDLSIAIIRSVVRGILGVAIIQTILAGIGLLVMGVPGAGLWACLVLVLAIAQLPTILILGPITLWVFSVADPVPASLFMIYMVLVGISDSFLKPMLLGRGVEVPMLVILIGAIGGAISMGIIGLFLGAVVLALGYELFKTWLRLVETDKN